MSAQTQVPEPILAALRAEVAVRSSKGAYVYPIVAALVVVSSELWDERRLEGIAFIVALGALAVARSYVTHRASVRRTEQAHRALVAMVALQSTCWGSFVASLFLAYGFSAVTWLAAMGSAAFAAGGTSAMGIDASVHRPFLAGMAAPIFLSTLATRDPSGLTFSAGAVMYCWFLLRDARQHAEAYRALLDAQQELRAARDLARAADQAKSTFLAMMSHEIRTPMHAAVGTASMLLETTLDERQRRHVETIVRAGETLVELINDVLDLSRMDARGTQLDTADFELKIGLLEVAHMFEPLARRAELDFELELDESVAIYVSGDRRRLQQILVNLIGNAIKFTERGGIRLKARARPLARGFELAIEIADTGIGIEPAQLQRMFQPFEQADSGIARKYGGTGLGLAISKRLAEAMGGRIEVSSIRGKGTTFTVVVQLSAATSERPRISSDSTQLATARATLPSGTRVLVVDDSELNRELAQEMLERLGCTVQSVGSGAEAIEIARTSPFDVVLMDCQMRELDGYATTRQLRALGDACARVPIIAVTANAFADDRQRALEAGMNDLLAKPFGLRDLQRTLSRWLIAAGAPPLSELPPAPTAADNASLYPQAMRHIAALLDGAFDESMIDHVVEAFLQQWPQRRAALEQAIAGGDVGVLREIIHALDGAVPYFGSDRLNAALRRLQQQARASDMMRARIELQDLTALVDELSASRERHRLGAA